MFTRRRLSNSLLLALLACATAFAQAVVARKIEGNTFVIKTNKPRVEVSWQVTGVRRDAYANRNRIQVEEEKTERERGTYLHPEAFGRTKP